MSCRRIRLCPKCYQELDLCDCVVFDGVNGVDPLDWPNYDSANANSTKATTPAGGQTKT